MRRLCLLIAACLALTACKKERQIEVRYICPAIIEYSKEFQAALDREVAQLDAPYLFQILNDFGITRQALRKCRVDQKKAEEQARRSKKGKKK
jgi:Tfp pilus assembly protein PilP